MNKKRQKLKKKNPMAKLLSSPMLRNKIVKNKKKIYNRKNSNWGMHKKYE